MKLKFEVGARIGVSEDCGRPTMKDLGHAEIHPGGPGPDKVGVNLLTPEDRLPACFVVSKHDARALGEALIEASES